MKHITAIFAAACSIAAATPAFAEDPRPEARAAVAKPASATNPDQRICFRDALTGSRIMRTECKTRAEWTKLGVKTPAR